MRQECPEEGDYKSDGFRIIHSRGEESQGGVAVILDKITANCVEKVQGEGDRLLMVKLKGKPVGSAGLAQGYRCMLLLQAWAGAYSGSHRLQLVKAAELTLGHKTREEVRKPWVTDEMIDVMEERRKWKSIHSEEGRQNYKSLNNRLRRITDKAREKMVG